ncbi:Lysine-specific demethylase 4 [Frankliniella fusca]|uniref:Lysine-specific demethylase 4 n=1 Tax=Frankliniella fusca TaxID=407009 RepID=A0AAE1HPN0_9NEOP|nr:Lysine-specific demethylase 4 [Frankliniella fusca]
MSMFPDDEAITTDNQGLITVLLRLSEEDRQDDEVFKTVMSLMKVVFDRKVHDKVTKSEVFEYQPDCQVAFATSPDHDIFQYIRVQCSPEEREKFVLKESGVTGLANHCFGVLRAQRDASLKNDEKISSILYGAGIQLHRGRKIKLCRDFSLSNLKTVLDHASEKYDGLAYPYVYSGTAHSFFPWHIEDAGLYSINYNIKGAPKLWFGIEPQYFGLVDKICSSLHIDKGYTSCRALLVDHKVVVANPKYFFDLLGIPYTIGLQEPGDFMVTFPFALHAGFNLGHNLATAANFGDPEWVELGIYAPICLCNPEEIHLDFTNIIRKCRPDLLNIYNNKTILMFPKSHPMEVLYPACSDGNDGKQTTEQKVQTEEEAQPASCSSRVRRPLRDRIIVCPKCKQTFSGNKVSRCKDHIMSKHPADSLMLCRQVDAQYPPFQPKSNQGHECPVCKTFLRGSTTHLHQHIRRFHPDQLD